MTPVHNDNDLHVVLKGWAEHAIVSAGNGVVCMLELVRLHAESFWINDSIFHGIEGTAEYDNSWLI